MKKLIVIIWILGNTFSLSASEIDSLINLSQYKTGTAKIDLYNTICWKLRNSDPERAIPYGTAAIELAGEINYHDGQMQAYSFTGVLYRNLGFYTKAFELYFAGLELTKKYNNTEQQGYAHINLANLYLYQNQADKALEHLLQAEPLAKNLENRGMVAYVALNLGRVYSRKNLTNKAIEQYEKSIKLRGEMNKPNDQAVGYKYMGDVFLESNRHTQALEAYQKAIRLADLESDMDLHADITEHITMVYIRVNQLDSASWYATQSLQISKQVNSKLRIKNAYQLLAEIYMKRRDFNKAYNYQSLVIRYKDSLYNEEVSKKIASIEFTTEQQKKQAEIDLLNKDLQIQELSLKRQKAFSYAMGAIIVLGSLIVFLMWRMVVNNRRSNKKLESQKFEIVQKNEELKKQNEEIAAQRDHLEVIYTEMEIQRDELHSKQKQITDSIHYAKRIQNAIFPVDSRMQELFQDFFVINKPRDIVSGDFYWLFERRDNIYFATADCTGHGVPGAFMSLLSITFLNEIISVESEEIAEPDTGKVLNELRKRIKKALNQTGQWKEAKDGLDIALVRINKAKMKLQFSGAHCSMFVLYKDTLHELQADRMPIAIYRKESPFNISEIQIEKGSKLYMYTDGIVDQVGGPKGRKFFKRSLQAHINLMHKLPMKEQKFRMQSEIDDFMGESQKQIDDMLLIGLKV